ncbi:MAG: aminoacyl-tRNA hydrolase [Fusobacterium sp. JB021]|nr:aminoacyl-tRNA hydrolase [Fusobacterium sp. JB020]MDP0493354.1 aminoacyl-tRNA hydrolase [Fusobacterium sp. JB021]MDP0507587.1 aminoacyl-tRNA hydrolase [Fusobacterium sp. JB019]
MKLIIGLGNPGKKYEKTRHNIGFMVVDEISRKLNLNNFKEKFKGLLIETSYNNEKLFLLKPQTYMNLSGESIVELVNFYKLDIEKDVIVIYDDMSMDFGKIRIREKGSAGGHNGIKSIISFLGDKFTRIKVGIGGAKTDDKIIEHVIGRFSIEEEKDLGIIIENVSEMTLLLAKGEKKDKVLQKTNKK